MKFAPAISKFVLALLLAVCLALPATAQAASTQVRIQNLDQIPYDITSFDFQLTVSPDFAFTNISFTGSIIPGTWFPVIRNGFDLADRPNVIWIAIAARNLITPAYLPAVSDGLLFTVNFAAGSITGFDTVTPDPNYQMFTADYQGAGTSFDLFPTILAPGSITPSVISISKVGGALAPVYMLLMD